MARFKYDASRVRASFRSKFCKELDLPSGKKSGFYVFPIEEDEINRLMGNCEFNMPDGEFETISEWMLWSALRMKYGINYLHPTSKQARWFLFGSDIGEPAEKSDDKLEELELRMQNYIDNEMKYFSEYFLSKINDGQKSTVKTIGCMEEDYRKYFKKTLDIPEF